MTMSNASIFRRYARAEDQMVRATMPRTSERDVAPLRESSMRRVIGTRNGLRLVAPLTVSIAEMMAVAR